MQSVNGCPTLNGTVACFWIDANQDSWVIWAVLSMMDIGAIELVDINLKYESKQALRPKVIGSACGWIHHLKKSLHGSGLAV